MWRDTWVPPHMVFVGQGPCALPGVREKNPPVTASPCQPPLGKGAYKDGGTDCHSQCAHWLRNDTGFCLGYGVRRDTWVPPHIVFIGQGPCALPGVHGKNPPVTASPCQPPLSKGGIRTGIRIATTSLRTGLAMTWFLQGVRGVIQMVFSK